MHSLILDQYRATFDQMLKSEMVCGVHVLSTRGGNLSIDAHSCSHATAALLAFSPSTA